MFANDGTQIEITGESGEVGIYCLIYQRKIDIFWSWLARTRCLKVTRLSFSTLNTLSLYMSASASCISFLCDGKTNITVSPKVSIFLVSSSERKGLNSNFKLALL